VAAAVQGLPGIPLYDQTPWALDGGVAELLLVQPAPLGEVGLFDRVRSGSMAIG
jgi:hypothetical protein